MRTSQIKLSVALILLCGLVAACSTQSTPASGEWMAAVDFGQIGFTVGSDGASIPQSRYDVNQFDCAGSTISAGVQHATEPAAAIVNGSFHDQANLDVEGSLVIDVSVTFSEDGLWANGSYEITAPSGSCSGNFEAFPDSLGALY